MEYMQWLGIEVIYAHELVVLPLVVLALHFTHKGNSVLVWTAHWLLYTAVAFYLISFHMHHYSHWAWPVILAMFVYHRIRRNWPWVISWRLSDVKLWLAARTRWQTIAGGVVLGLFAVYLGLTLPWSFLGVLLLMAAVIALVLKTLAWLRGGEGGLLAYLDRDPRMGVYFDWVRRLQGKTSSVSSLLAENRLTSRPELLEDDVKALRPRWDFCHPGFWISGLWFFKLNRFSGVCTLARWYWRTRCHWLDSAFVVDCLEHARKCAWWQYERARWGGEIEDYLETVRKERHLPVELAPNARAMRLRWLLLTEAMGERYALADPHGRLDNRSQPNLLRAADVLTSAGQLQLEITWDFEKAKALDQEANRERRLARHFYDLSARCLEAYLDDNFQPSAPAESLANRAERFCGPVQEEDWWESQNEAVDGEPVDEQQGVPKGNNHEEMAKKNRDWADFCHRETKTRHLRLALAWHYLLIAALSARSADTDQQKADRDWLNGPGKELFDLLLHRIEKYPLPQGGSRPQALVLHGAAEVSYMLECQEAGAARQVFGKLISGNGEAEPLVLLAGSLHNLEQWQQIEPQRIYMLLGMTQEASMAGAVGDIRNMRLKNAALLYSRANSRRVWRLQALQQRAPEYRGKQDGLER